MTAEKSPRKITRHQRIKRERLDFIQPLLRARGFRNPTKSWDQFRGLVGKQHIWIRQHSDRQHVVALLWYPRDPTFGIRLTTDANSRYPLSSSHKNHLYEYTIHDMFAEPDCELTHWNLGGIDHSLSRRRAELEIIDALDAIDNYCLNGVLSEKMNCLRLLYSGSADGLIDKKFPDPLYRWHDPAPSWIKGQATPLEREFTPAKRNLDPLSLLSRFWINQAIDLVWDRIVGRLRP